MDSLIGFIESGGNALIVLGGEANSPLFDEILLKPLGLSPEEGKLPEREMRRPAAIEWVDLAHPAFKLFRGTRYNDFSQLRANRHERLVFE